MILEQTLLYILGAIAAFCIIRWGLIPAFKYIFAPQLHELAAKRKKRIAEADLTAEKLEAEALTIRSQQDQIARESLEALLHADDDDHHGRKHVH